MSIFGAAKRGWGMLGKLKPKPKPQAKGITKPKTAKEKHDEFMQKDPYERGAIISRRESAKRGDVYTGTSVVGTPSPHRSAKAIKKYSGPHSYQLTDPKRRGPKAAGGRIGFKRAGPVTKSDLAKRDLWTKRNLKKRANIKRKSKWDIRGGIAGHPLNPVRLHAEIKSHEPWKMRSDVYTRTRDDLKKSRDPKVKGVAENFQKMDYKDKAKGTYQEKDYAPKLTKRVHVGRKTGGRIGLQAGGPPSFDKRRQLKEKLREQYYKKHGKPGDFEKKAREARAKLDTRKPLAVSDPHKRTRHSIYGLKHGGKPHSTKKGRKASLKRSFKRQYQEVRAAFPGDFKGKKKRKLR